MTHPIDKKLDKKGRLQIFLKGIAMGCADIIPGVSGGTIAFMFGIYEDFILSIKSFDTNFVKYLLKGEFRSGASHVAWNFLLCVVGGIAAAIIALSSIISWLLTHEPILINSFFFGLILATVPIIARIMKKWTFLRFFLIVVSTALTFKIVELAPLQTPENYIFIFLCGALAISAMILPGISGAFILVLLGKYQFIVEAVHHRDLIIIAVFLFGIIVGVLSFVRLISYVFSKYHDSTIAVLTGIVLGSLNKIWPWKITTKMLHISGDKTIPLEQINIFPNNFLAEEIFAFSLMVIGFVLAFSLNKSHKHIKLEKPYS